MNSTKISIVELSSLEVSTINGGLIDIKKHKYEPGFTITIGVLSVAIMSVGLIPAGAAAVSAHSTGFFCFLPRQQRMHYFSV